MESWNQRRAVVESITHWRKPSSAVRGNRVAFSSAFTRSSRRSHSGTLVGFRAVLFLEGTFIVFFV